jgi:hypothetical protein
MDLYILDDLIRRIDVVDRFESLIWTERYAAFGDFELHIQSTWTNRNRFKNGKWLAVNESQRVMMIETVEDGEDSEGRSMLKVTGRSLEAILEDRVARHSFVSLTASPRWALLGTPGYLGRAIVKSICVDGLLNTQDIIQYLKVPLTQEDSLLPVDTIPEPSTAVRMELEPMSLYAALKLILDEYDLGFCILRNQDKSELYFEVYSGSDRTSAQSSISPMIFSPELNNLVNSKELKSVASYKNTAYVLSPSGSTIVYTNDGSGHTGVDRHILMVKVDEVRQNDSENWMTVEQILQRRGREALTEHRKISAFDGEIAHSGYKYGVDYRLGDLVELRKYDDASTSMRVTEQIFVSDSQGDRSYPTLAPIDLT